MKVILNAQVEYETRIRTDKYVEAKTKQTGKKISIANVTDAALNEYFDKRMTKEGEIIGE